MKPMLAQSVDVADMDTYINSDQWVFQQKLDGDRVLIQVDDGDVTALNRQGEVRRKGVPAKILREFSRMPGTWVFDGELLLDGVLWLFDMPVAEVHVRPERSYDFRLCVLERFYSGWVPDPCVRLLPTARTTEAKISLVEQVVAQNGEGLVFKDLTAPYRPGKRSGAMLKAKFTKTVDVVVTDIGVDGRNNCACAVFRDGALVEIGTCSLDGKPPVRIGDVVEVRYLYATDDNRLYQPRIERVRTDKAATECMIDQLVYTDRSIVTPDERPMRATSASFVSRVLREAGIPKASAYAVGGRERDGFEVGVRRGSDVIYVMTTLRHAAGRHQIEEIRQVLTDRDVLCVNDRTWGLDGVYVLVVKGRR